MKHILQTSRTDRDIIPTKYPEHREKDHWAQEDLSAHYKLCQS